MASTTASSTPPAASSAPRTRKVLVRRRRAPLPEPALTPRPSKTSVSKKVLLARRIRPGQTLKLNGERGGTVTMSTDPRDVQAVPQSVLYNDTGDHFHHQAIVPDDPNKSILGPAIDYEVASRLHSLTDKVPATPGRFGASGMAALVERQNELYRAHMKQVDTAREKERVDQNERMRSMLCGEKILATREARILHRWVKANETWEKTRRFVSGRIGIEANEMAMDKGREYREKLEALQLLSNVMPKKIASAACWKMTLRGDATTYVQVGNMFSGLFCAVKNSDATPMETIRWPTRAIEPGEPPAEPAPVPKWKSSPAYRQRKQMLRGRINSVRPHEITETAGLEVVGQDLFNLRRVAPAYCIDYSPVKTRFALQSPPRQEGHAKAGLATDDVKPIEEVAVEAQPCLEIDRRVVMMESQPGRHSATGHVTIVNSGTTVVHCHWEIVPPPEPSLPTTPDSPRQFWWGEAPITLLPGDTASVGFHFVAERAGVALQTVVLVAFPVLPTGSPMLLLKGVCTDLRGTIDTDRAVLLSQIHRDSIAFEMRRHVLACIDAVRPSAIPTHLEPIQFHRVNRARRLWYYPDLLVDFNALAERLRCALGRRARLAARWDFSVDTLSDTVVYLEQIGHPDAIECRKTINLLSAKAAVRPAPSPFMYAVVSAVINSVGVAVPDRFVAAQIILERDEIAAQVAEQARLQEEAAQALRDADAAAKAAGKKPVKAATGKAPTKEEEAVAAATIVAPVVIVDEGAQRERERAKAALVSAGAMKLVREALASSLAQFTNSAAITSMRNTLLQRRSAPSYRAFTWAFNASTSGSVLETPVLFASRGIVCTHARRLCRLAASAPHQTLSAFDSCNLVTIHALVDGSILAVMATGDVIKYDGTHGTMAMEREGAGVVQVVVAATSGVRLARDNLGAVSTWANGNGTQAEKITLPDRATLVCAGDQHLMALTADGRLFSWGTGDNVLLGRTGDATNPAQIVLGERIVQASAFGDMSAACTESGKLFVWGRSQPSALGIGAGIAQTVLPGVMEQFAGRKIVKVSLGAAGNVSVTDAGVIFEWGRSVAAAIVPAVVASPLPVDPAAAAAAAAGALVPFVPASTVTLPSNLGTVQSINVGHNGFVALFQ